MFSNLPSLQESYHKISAFCHYPGVPMCSPWIIYIYRSYNEHYCWYWTTMSQSEKRNPAGRYLSMVLKCTNPPAAFWHEPVTSSEACFSVFSFCSCQQNSHQTTKCLFMRSVRNRGCMFPDRMDNIRAVDLSTLPIFLRTHRVSAPGILSASSKSMFYSTFSIYLPEWK